MDNEFSRIVDTLPGLVWTALPDGRIDFLNYRRLGAQHGVTARGPRSSSGGLGRRGGGAGGEKGLYFSYPF
jgi:hypothetical protein